MSQDARPGGQRLRAEGRPAPSAGARPLFTLCPTVWGEIRGPASPLPVPLAVRMVSSGQRAHSLTASSLTGPPTQGEVGCGVSRSSGLPAKQRAPRDIPPTKQERVELSRPPARQPERELLPRVVSRPLCGVLRGAVWGRCRRRPRCVPRERPSPCVRRARCGCRRGGVCPSSLWGARGCRAQSRGVLHPRWPGVRAWGVTCGAAGRRGLDAGGLGA